MDTIKTSEEINHDRRRFVETAAAGIAAAGVLSLLPEHTAAATNDNAIRPFIIQVPEEVLVDLRRRINATKWPDRETVTDESQGVQLATMQELARYWGTDYDWRKCEAKLNAPPQFITEIDGLDIHFIHVRSKHENALPLIVTHGWPGSIIEQLKIIDPLTNPAAHDASASDAFHVVIPSLPGYGFSARSTMTGWGPDRTVRAWILLMKRLGYTQFVAQGGDLGAGVCTVMAKQASRIDGHSHQLPWYYSTRHCEGAPVRRSAASRSVSRRTTRVRAAGRVIHKETRLRTNDGDSPADALWIGGLADRLGSLAL